MKNHGVLSSDSAALAPIRKGRYDELLQEDEEEEEETAILQVGRSCSQREADGQGLFPNKQSAEMQLPHKIVDKEDELLADTYSKGTEGA